MTTESQRDPEFNSVVRALEEKYNSDANFRSKIKDEVKSKSHNFLADLVQSVVGHLAKALLDSVLNALMRIFR
jgi:hypothetical protein